MKNHDENPVEAFRNERLDAAREYRKNKPLLDASQEWLTQAFRTKYMYNFAWMGRPIIQLPTDIVTFQEIVWSVKPDLIVETGIAHGGSLILSASLLALLDYCDAVENKKTLDPQKPQRRVLGVDIDIRSHNREAIEQHSLSNRIDMIQGSSVADEVIKQVRDIAKGYSNVLVCLDSMHTHDHVLKELQLYAPLVTKGSYCLAFDTIVEDLPNDMFPDRPWEHGNNPKTAVRAYLEGLNKNGGKGYDGKDLQFEIDQAIENKMLISAIPEGVLKRV